MILYELFLLFSIFISQEISRLLDTRKETVREACRHLRQLAETYNFHHSTRRLQDRISVTVFKVQFLVSSNSLGLMVYAWFLPSVCRYHWNFQVSLHGWGLKDSNSYVRVCACPCVRGASRKRGIRFWLIWYLRTFSEENLRSKLKKWSKMTKKVIFCPFKSAPPASGQNFWPSKFVLKSLWQWGPGIRGRN